MSARPEPVPRAAFAQFEPLQLRWHDNDLYGHVNNARYYDLFDTAVNGYLLRQGALDLHTGEGVFLVVSSGCDYFTEMAFPTPVEAGLRVDRLGATSVTYGIGLFAGAADTCAALGRFVHVHVHKETRRPHPMPAAVRAALSGLVQDI